MAKGEERAQRGGNTARNRLQEPTGTKEEEVPKKMKRKQGPTTAPIHECQIDEKKRVEGAKTQKRTQVSGIRTASKRSRKPAEVNT